jgi:hypothetical protein
VVRLLRDLDGTRSRWSGAVETFLATYCALEDGHAAARVYDAVFAGPRDESGTGREDAEPLGGEAT